tara:strand:+ start:3102 stop:3707 length:606 start_codon:yes stop_codon:yes gene_type:complete
MEENSMDPNVWGPSLWDLLFYIACNVDIKTQYDRILSLFQLLETMLPCSQCRRHYATYRAEVPPLSQIKRNKPESAAIWLWVIHDMVNQSIGKHCISYEKVKKKHEALTCIVSDTSVFDCFMFIWFSSKKKIKLAEGLQITLDLLKSIQHFHICTILQDKIDETWKESDMLDAKNKILSLYGKKEQTLDEFIKQYSSAIAE